MPGGYGGGAGKPIRRGLTGALMGISTDSEREREGEGEREMERERRVLGDLRLVLCLGPLVLGALPIT